MTTKIQTIQELTYQINELGNEGKVNESLVLLYTIQNKKVEENHDEQRF